ncbi:uracil-DNA glycosylase [Robertmurraya yapensis]|uniref:Uracil-DNA glycosylase n=1 Tax=Bacillus yapensis TaxID=2492960 RepID=A0A431WC37_9BACI|nr:uracil-DNA glycosylase [Bacillus yapensis]RTR33052.1 uracil-DNA glycosylase [Bacillus yapensis]TKS96875.1 uracil-DNA glycosylase [Bacillus yapensis]
MKINVQNDWHEQIGTEFEKSYFQELINFLEEEYKHEVIYPERDDIFNALTYTAYNDVKVVILGQDPYHGPNQAHGLSFSVKKGVTHPPSLKNIYKELEADIGCTVPAHGDLTRWAKQGVLLLNTVLTVRQGAAHSHKGKGWEIFTDHVISRLNERETPVIFVLWGLPAQKKKKLIDESKHFIIESVHPSPLSVYRGFFGSKPFSKINQYLRDLKQEEIDWELEK